ncbi:hypothetical protein KBJ98_01485 [Flavobacterium sp. F-328]|jgi:hypothetical protein|uniref:Uncharacterized protein n=3 Tax=Flavobacteriales TaxID=200644 RepID=A0A9Q3UYC0_9FLAO|nr:MULTISPECIES: hypothetical protein [Flavobacteriales]MBD3906116.1 hypothetical protein [Chryseobacterium muglaense]MBQ0907370.1 hypothetical protein [Flavobacterium erciyesense]MCC9036206.1 hypothetical protein [Chryseobacterium muglaense]MCC9070596.1 hypothetical protein [Flavobacterium sp. F-65]MCM2553219.1 hypothetical protein [Chryseobacterium muglaense]
METLSDLNTFAKILTDKGYNGYFHTQGAYAGRLKDTISDYIESCQKGTDSLPKQDLLLTGYLQWSGDDKPRVECSMWVKYLNGKFSLNKMEVARKDQFGQLLKKSELTNLSVISAPKAAEVVALVNDELKQKAGKSPKRFKL